MVAWLGWFLFLGATELINPAPTPVSQQRIVSLAPAATEIVFALGSGNEIVGVTRYDTYPPQVLGLPRVGGLVDPDEEAVAALHPTLVIALPATRGRAGRLARLGPSVLVAPAETLDDMWTLIVTLGRMLQREAAAATLTAKLQQEFAQLKSEAAHAHPKPLRALLMVGHRPWVAAGPGSFIDTLLPMVGASNALRRGGSYPVLDAEAMLATHPDVIVNLVQQAPDARWLGATRIRVVNAHDDALMLPGPRLPQALRQLSAQLWSPAPSPP